MNDDPGALVLEGRYAEAEVSYRALLAVEGRTPGLLLNFGLCLKALGKLPEAFDAVQEACDKAPDRADIWNELGLLWDEDGRLTKAEACYRRAVELDPGLATAWNNLGVCAFLRQDFPKAKECFSKAVELDPGMESAKLNLADTLEELG